MSDNHDHDMLDQPAQPINSEGFLPPAELQVGMLRQEISALRDEMLTLRIQNSFQTDVIKALQHQIKEMADKPSVDNSEK